MQVTDPPEEARVLRPDPRPLLLGGRRIQQARLELGGFAQGGAKLVEEREPALVGADGRAQFQRLGPRSSTRRPRQYFTLPPPPPPRVPYPSSRVSTNAASPKSAGTTVSSVYAPKAKTSIAPNAQAQQITSSLQNGRVMRHHVR